MRLEGNKLDRYNRGYIQALIFKPELDVENPIDLLIDTGSAKTMISTLDAENIGIDIKKLKRSSKPVRGLGGGEITARHLGNCQLVFVFQTTALVENLDDILILEDNGGKENEEESSSILGMDVLRNYNIACSGEHFVLER